MIQSSNIQTKSVGMKIFTDDQIWEIKQAAFDIIERVGFKCRHKQVHKMMKQAGAWVKEDNIKIPRHIVKECLVTTPTGWTIYDRKWKVKKAIREPPQPVPLPVMHLPGK